MKKVYKWFHLWGAKLHHQSISPVFAHAYSHLWHASQSFCLLIHSLGSQLAASSISRIIARTRSNSVISCVKAALFSQIAREFPPLHPPSLPDARISKH